MGIALALALALALHWHGYDSVGAKQDQCYTMLWICFCYTMLIHKMLFQSSCMNTSCRVPSASAIYFVVFGNLAVCRSLGRIEMERHDRRQCRSNTQNSISSCGDDNWIACVREGQKREKQRQRHRHRQMRVRPIQNHASLYQLDCYAFDTLAI